MSKNHDLLVRQGQLLEVATLSWNIVGVIVLAFGAIAASSVALLAFGLDSLIEIGASTVVLWELADRHARRQELGLKLIGWAFVLLAVYLTIQSVYVLAVGHHARASHLGIGWTALTAAVMFALAYGKRRTGTALKNPVLVAESKVTVIDGVLATAVAIGLLLNAALGWWWADPAVGLIVVYYAIREALHLLKPEQADSRN